MDTGRGHPQAAASQSSSSLQQTKLPQAKVRRGPIQVWEYTVERRQIPPDILELGLSFDHHSFHKKKDTSTNRSHARGESRIEGKEEGVTAWDLPGVDDEDGSPGSKASGRGENLIAARGPNGEVVKKSCVLSSWTDGAGVWPCQVNILRGGRAKSGHAAHDGGR